MLHNLPRVEIGAVKIFCSQYVICGDAYSGKREVLQDVEIHYNQIHYGSTNSRYLKQPFRLRSARSQQVPLLETQSQENMLLATLRDTNIPTEILAASTLYSIYYNPCNKKTKIGVLVYQLYLLIKLCLNACHLSSVKCSQLYPTQKISVRKMNLDIFKHFSLPGICVQLFDSGTAENFAGSDFISREVLRHDFIQYSRHHIIFNTIIDHRVDEKF